MMDANLIKSYMGNVSSLNQEPESQTEERTELEREMEEIEKEVEICDTRENSELNSSLLDRTISNTSVLDSRIPKVSIESDLSENGLRQYYSRSIEHLKDELKDTFDYTKTRNYITKKQFKKMMIALIAEAKKKSKEKKDEIQFTTVNFQFKFVMIIRVNAVINRAFYYNPFLGYHFRDFRNNCIIPNGNTEKSPVISKDKNDAYRNLKEGSNKKDKEEPKIEEPKKDEIEIEEYKTRSQRMNEKKRNYKNYGNNYYGKRTNNYNKKNYHQSNYSQNYKNYNRFNKSEY